MNKLFYRLSEFSASRGKLPMFIGLWRLFTGKQLSPIPIDIRDR